MKNLAGKKRFICKGRVEYFSHLADKRVKMGASDVLWAFDEDDARKKFEKKLGRVELQDCSYNPNDIIIESYNV
jgi:hypothetical protein